MADLGIVYFVLQTDPGNKNGTEDKVKKTFV